MAGPLVKLSLDDEEVGGRAIWYEVTVPGAIPQAGDWVWSPSDNAPFEVVRIGWTFVQVGSFDANHDEWTPLVRVHVRRWLGSDLDA